jgi:thioredoxin 1
VNAQEAATTADDTSFNRLVLKAALPTIALFIADDCAVCDACAAVFGRLATRYRGRVGVVTLDLDMSGVIAESFGVQAVPAYVLFRAGEPIASGLGYLPETLLDLFFQEAIEDAGAWPPTEQQIEDALLLPMLQRWGWQYQRQYQLTRRAAHTRRGAIDLLVSPEADAPPCTLFENKRRVADSRDLQRAVEQAHGYARELGLEVFVIADAARLWVYRIVAEHPTLLRLYTWLELERDDSALRELLGGYRR